MFIDIFRKFFSCIAAVFGGCWAPSELKRRDKRTRFAGFLASTDWRAKCKILNNINFILELYISLLTGRALCAGRQPFAVCILRLIQTRSLSLTLCVPEHWRSTIDRVNKRLPPFERERVVVVAWVVKTGRCCDSLVLRTESLHRRIDRTDRIGR